MSFDEKPEANVILEKLPDGTSYLTVVLLHQIIRCIMMVDTANEKLKVNIIQSYLL